MLAHLHLHVRRPYACALALVALLTGCAHREVATNWRAAGTDNAPLGQLGELVLREADLPTATQKRLTEIEDEGAQQLFVTLWTGLEDAAGERLLHDEATRRRVSYEALVKEEIEDRVGTPSDAEIHGLYDANRDTIGITFAEAAPFLRQQYFSDRLQALRRAVVDRLRQGRELQLLLPPPPLSRTPVSARGPSMGPEQAQVTLVVFSDFQCPYSAQARRLVKRLAELYPDTLRVVHHDFPLDQHRDARRAAEAAQCAAEQNKFWAYHELLFENTAVLTTDNLRRFASTAELDVKAFNACLTSPRPGQAISRDLAEGRALGVRGTPAMFLNGMHLSGVLPLGVVRAFVDQELTRGQGSSEAER
jgi:protein-disulfide isomerase